MNDHLRVLTRPGALDPGEGITFVSTPEAGATALFCGTVRSPNEGADVDHLFYEVWQERVESSLRHIAADALQRYGGCRAYVAHRTGEVGVGEASVVVAVSASHREEAFEACRFVIDQLKERAPIWKKEITEEGQRWIGSTS